MAFAAKNQKTGKRNIFIPGQKPAAMNANTSSKKDPFLFMHSPNPRVQIATEGESKTKNYDVNE